jgi:hypothetical protein
MDQRNQQLQQNRKTFFSSQNEQMLYTILSNNFAQKTGSSLNDAQASRLERALEHYMGEVFQANSTLPVQTLNKEVLSASASDFTEYLQRQELVKKSTPQGFQEASQRFDQMQQDRQRSLEPPRPSVPDYVQPIIIKEDDSTTALTLFEEAKKRRNMEMSAQADEQIQRRSASAMKPIYLQDQESRPDPRALYSMPLDLVAAGQQGGQQQEGLLALSGRADMNPTLARPGPTVAPRNVLQQDMIIKQEDIQSYKETEYNLSIYSADRNWQTPVNTEENRFNFSVNLFSGNSPTGLNLMPKSANRLKNIVRIEFVKAVIPIEATDIVIRKVNSTDTPNYIQALVNAQAVAITSVNAGASVAPQPAANLAQGNLSKLIEYNNLMGDSPGGEGSTLNRFRYDTTYVKSIYSYPFVTLNVDELDTNTFGTNNSMDNAFGILQYDSNWTDNTDSLGFTSLIPKHMKCQRVFSPTPLATLNKMTIRLQQPNGKLINPVQDTLDIKGLFLSMYSSIREYFSGNIDLSGTPYSDSVGEYIWIDCRQWFSRFQFNAGDRIQIKNLTCTQPTAATTNLMNYLQNMDGLLVVATAYLRPITAQELIDLRVDPTKSLNIGNGLTGSTANQVLADGCNTAGYAQYLIVRGQFNDPTTGATNILPYGNQADNSLLATNMITGITAIKPGRLINLSKQTQLIFRVITREYDSTSLVRPDNL